MMNHKQKESDISNDDLHSVIYRIAKLTDWLTEWMSKIYKEK